MRALVRRLPAEPASHRRDDGRARRVRRPRDGSPLVDQDLADLRAHRDCAAARRFFERAIDLHGVPEKITIDKSGANGAAIAGLRADSGADIELRQSKYLNNIVEQDRSTPGFAQPYATIATEPLRSTASAMGASTPLAR